MTLKPSCEKPSCPNEATVFLGFHGFDGATTRFIRTKALCDEHYAEYQRTVDPNAGAVEYVR